MATTDDISEIIVLLDRSGSMNDAKSDHEGGLNSFVEDQKKIPGDVKFTFIRFDTEAPCEIVYDGVPIQDVGHCDLIPRGGTPLIAAGIQAIAHVAKRIDSLTQKPDQVLFMIITDGKENSSYAINPEYTKTNLCALVKEREEKYKWKFLFLGANIDAFDEAGGLGISQNAAMAFSNTSGGVKAMYQAASGNTGQARDYIKLQKAAGEAVIDQDGLVANYNWTPEQRAASGSNQSSGLDSLGTMNQQAQQNKAQIVNSTSQTKGDSK